jgi:uncharacterized protein YbaR (Trm112 family)
MLRDLLDALRCPHDHEESWLVAVVREADGPQLIDAALACPVCGAEFLVRHGVADFGGPPLGSGPDTPDAERLAALLGVSGGHRPLLLTGHYARAGAALSAFTTAPQIWLDAPEDANRELPALSCVRGAGRLPMGVDTLAAAAIDARHASPAMLASIARAVGQGGRMVAPAATPVPETLRVLARDATEWVAETTTRASGLIELRRRASVE